MFEDSLVESSGRLAARHPWTTAISFALQAMALSALLLLSLLYTESLPTQRWINVLQAPPPPPAAAPSHNVIQAGAQTTSNPGVLTVPREIPRHIATGNDQAPPQVSGPGILNGVGAAVPNAIPGGVLEALTTSSPASPKPAVQKVRVSSGVAEGMLVSQVKPQYPAPARLARIEGRVVLQAVIGRDGAVQNVHVISGHPFLVSAAIDAVKQWRYRPYLLNGEPVEVETQIVMNFVLTGN